MQKPPTLERNVKSINKIVTNFGKLIQSILNKTSNKGESIKAPNTKGVPRYDPAAITNEFCKHFSSIGETVANKIPPSTQRKPLNT